MTPHSVVVGLSLLAVVMSHDGQQRSASAGKDAGRAADLAAIEKLFQQDIAATVSRDSVALSDAWTDDAIRAGIGAPTEIGKQAIRASNDRQTANKNLKVVSYVPETKDLQFLDGGWAVALRAFTASVVAAPGAAPVQVRGQVMMVLKKLPDGSWKVFRGLGGTDPAPSGK